MVTTDHMVVTPSATELANRPARPSALAWLVAGVVLTLAAQLAVKQVSYVAWYDQLVLSGAMTPGNMFPRIGDEEPAGVELQPGNELLFSLYVENVGSLAVRLDAVEQPHWYNLELVEVTHANWRRPQLEWPRLRPVVIEPGGSVTIGLRLKMHPCEPMGGGTAVIYSSVPVRTSVGPFHQRWEAPLSERMYVRAPANGLKVPDGYTPACERLWEHFTPGFDWIPGRGGVQRDR